MNDVVPRTVALNRVVVVDSVALKPAELLEKLKSPLDGPTCDHSTAIAVSALRGICSLPPEVCDEELVDSLLRVAHYFYLSNESCNALESANAALSRARRLDYKPLLRKSLNFAGLMRAERLDLPGAIEALAEALEIARTLRDDVQQASVWNNLGVALMTSGQYQDARACLELAACTAAIAPLLSIRHVALGNVAYCALRLNDIENGVRAVRQAISLNSEPVTASDFASRVNAETNYARLLLELDEVGAATHRASLAQYYSERLPTPRTAYMATLTSGLIDLKLNRVDAGLARLTDAVVRARDSVSAELRDALVVCIDAHASAGRPDTALAYLHELLALNLETKAKQILMQQHFLATGFSLSGHEDDCALMVAARRLQGAVDSRLQHLINTAINASLASGHDLHRVFRVSKLADLFALSEGWSSERVRELALSGKLPDIGMIAMPESLLTKTRALSMAERKILDDHTRFGAELLSAAKLALVQPCVAVARFHHERWDGSGPWSLAGEAIPLEARVVALCDAFDAMTHPRPWRPQPLSAATALREIGDQAGRQFDPNLAARFVDFVQREFWKHDNFSDFLGEEALSNEYVRARLQIARMMANDDEAQP